MRLLVKGKLFTAREVVKAKFSPFEGREVKGVAVGTIVRGQPVMLDGEIVSTKGCGMNVKNYG